MNPVSLPARNPDPAPMQPSPKLLAAAHQFEAMLLDDLLGPMEKTFATLPGQKDVPGDSDYAYLATQALSTAMAAAGGLGIAQMIVHNVMLHQQVMSYPQAKVLPDAADKNRQGSAGKSLQENKDWRGIKDF